MVTIKSKNEIEYMREASKITALVHKKLEEIIKPGITTAYLDEVAERIIEEVRVLPIKHK